MSASLPRYLVHPFYPHSSRKPGILPSLKVGTHLVRPERMLRIRVLLSVRIHLLRHRLVLGALVNFGGVLGNVGLVTKIDGAELLHALYVSGKEVALDGVFPRYVGLCLSRRFGLRLATAENISPPDAHMQCRSQELRGWDRFWLGGHDDYVGNY